MVSPEFGPAFGDGPVRIVLGTDVARFQFGPPPSGGAWPLNSLWVAPPGYTGRVLVRGIASSGNTLRFRERVGSDLTDEIRIEWKRGTLDDSRRESDAWRQSGSYTWLFNPGCFQWQVDTLEGSDAIVFEVRLQA
jgi:hypothetical protein